MGEMVQWSWKRKICSSEVVQMKVEDGRRGASIVIVADTRPCETPHGPKLLKKICIHVEKKTVQKEQIR